MASHPYPSLHFAEQQIKAAVQAYAEELRRLFPDGTLVRINHYRGSYFAKVTGRDAHQHRLILTNNATGKRSYAYPRMRVGINDNDLPCVVVEN